jgi:hypothetical protein
LRFPRFFLNPKARLLWELLKAERRANARLRRELLEWQNKTLEQARISPLFQPKPPPAQPIEKAPIGPTAKRAYKAAHASPNEVPTAEQILAAAAKARNGNS